MLIRNIFVCCLLALSLHAQQGDGKDAPGEKQIARVPAEKIPPSPVLKPEDALKSFKLAPGFRIELVAAEPLIHDPVAITFDPDGRIWVVEMRGYMQTFDGKGEGEPVGSIAVLEDTNGDGKMDKRTVFLDGLVMPRAISLVRDGVLVATPPFLWFCRDTDGDLKCDNKIQVAKDYGDTKNPEHTANGLMWALDNWIYSADWTVRLKSVAGEEEWKREITAFRGQWGISQDDFGRLVYNSNSDQFRIDLVPSRYLQRNFHYKNPVGLNVDPIRDQTTWPIRVTPGVNRGYREGTLRPDGTLSKFTGACGPLIYRGDNFPSEFYGNAFVCEPCANLIKRNLLWEEKGTLMGKHAYTNSEFLASTDERFRPVNLNNGPDGSLYIVDLYRGVIQHKIFLTSYLRAQSESRGLEKPIGLGRIYRVVADGKKPGAKPNLSKATSANLVERLSNPNGWWRDTAQRLLVEKNDSSVVPALKTLAASGPATLGRLHAFWTLEGMEALDVDTILKGLADRDSKVKVAAIRLSELFLKSEAKETLLLPLIRLANETNTDVQLQLAFTLGEIADPKAELAMAVIAKNSSANPYIRDALLTGLHKRELEFLQKLLVNKAWDKSKTGNEAFLAGLAECVFSEAKTERINRLFELTASATNWQQRAVLSGIAATVPAAPKGKPAPKIRFVRFTEEPSGWKKLKANENAEVVALLKKMSVLVTWPGQPGYVPPPVVKPLTAEEQKRFEVGKELFTATCGACHQATGLGLDGLAPPLVDSDWVLGSDQRLARIVLHGVRGAISVNGKTWEMEMPSLSVFDDEQIASVLTYIRRDWGHTADPVLPETVQKVREQTANRMEAWLEAELLKVP